LKLPAARDVFDKQSRQFKALAEGSLSELDDSLLLRQYIDEREAVDAASHWRGGAFRLYESKHEKHPVLNFVSEWDSPAAAQKFFTLYQRVMKKKWKRFDPARIDSPGVLTGTGDSGRFRLTVFGSKVESIEGFPG
jgi:hypothetical protein